MKNIWTEAAVLYVHFKAFTGHDASVLMRRHIHIFKDEVKGIPGTLPTKLRGSVSWLAPGYKCAGCGRTFFVSEPEDLRHECTCHRGEVSDNKSMGVLDGIIA